MNRLRYTMFIVTVFLVLALSAVSTIPALADDGTPPPPPDTTTVETPPSDPIEETAPPQADVPPAADAAAETPAPEEPVSQDTTVAEALAQVPQGTDVVVLNDQGETVPLASQEAADTIVTADPIWCPAGVLPKPGVGGCTATYTNLALLIAAFTSNAIGDPGANGVIWITGFVAGGSIVDSSGVPIVIDGNDVNLSSWKNFTLTLNGGWVGGLAGSTTLVTSDPSQFDQSISIINWNADVTLNNLLISGVTVGSATNSAALDVQTTKKITVSNVKVNSNTGAGTVNGAWFDNADGASLVFGDVSITNSQFNSNKNQGLNVVSEGMITLSGVLANGNGGKGAWLDNQAASIAKTVTIITGTNQFNGNGDTGLEIGSKGAITLKDIDAVGNVNYGASLYNNIGIAGVTLSGSNFFTNNTGTGLGIGSKGIITISNLVADLNGLWGAYLENCDWSGSVCLGSGAVSLTGINEFKFNDGPGLQIASAGAITVNKITASNNGGSGMFIENSLGLPGLPQNVTLTGYGNFNNNWNSGLEILSHGTITLTNVIANDNGQSGTYGYGVYLNNYGNHVDFNGNTITPKAVTIGVSGTNPDTEIQDNFTGNLEIHSLGAINLTGVDANGSDNGDGAFLKNDYPGAVGGVTIGGWGGGFGDNAGNGLTIITQSAITATGLWAWGNQGYGAALVNSAAILGAPVTIGTVNGTSYGNNWGNGLYIASKGAITLNNINADNNGGNGAVLDNTSSATATITIKNTATAGPSFNWNGLDGLDILSNGTVSIMDLDASNNGQNNFYSSDQGDPIDDTSGFGVYIVNSGGLGNVTIGTARTNWCNGMSENFQSGLTIYSSGTVTLSNMCNRDNGGYYNITGFDPLNGDVGHGAYIDNTSAATPKTVTLNGDNKFKYNYDTGLFVTSDGAITVNNINADGNGTGAWLQNDSSPAAAVTIKNTPTATPSFNGNWLDGLDIFSNGIISIMDISASDNGQGNFVGADNGDPIDDSSGFGMYIENYGILGSVSIGTARANWCNDQMDNFQSGLTVYSSGAVTLSNMCNDGNGGYYNVTGFDPLNGDQGYGAYIDNSSAVTAKPVTLKGYNDFSNNYDDGLYVYTKGAIAINSLYASDNWSGSGAVLDNSASGNLLPQNVTLTGFNGFNDNDEAGLDVFTYGMITLNNIDAEGNGSDGAYLDNGCVDLGSGCTATLARAITLNGDNNFYNNGGDGLEVYSKGAIKVNNLSADWNAGTGALLDNSISSTPQALTLSGYAYTSNNGSDGLNAKSKGAILVTVSDMWAGLNTGGGWYLDNSGSGAVGGVTFSSPNTDWGFDFWNNGGDGLEIYSLGSITISGLDSSDNGGWGAVLDNSLPGGIGTITVTTSATGSNDFTGNGGSGLNLFSNRAITINNLYTDSNGFNGAVIDNTTSGSALPQNVTINGYGRFYLNARNGLKIFTYGLITLNNITANDNGQDNFYNAANLLPIDQTNGWGVILDNQTGTVTPKGITLNGTNDFHANFQDGLWATSLGAITVKQLTANSNGGVGADGGSGAILDNQFSGGTGTVSVTSATAISWNQFDGNAKTGLLVFSNRAVTVNNIMSRWNGLTGAYINTSDHFGLYALQNVTIAGRTMFIGNGSDGLDVYADGSISINNLVANYNTGDGAYLQNCLYDIGLAMCLGHGNVTITGNNVASFNTSGGSGLYVDTHGNVAISNIFADGNGTSGVRSYADGTTTISCGSMVNNGSFDWQLGSGLFLTLKGVVTSTGITTSLTNLGNGNLMYWSTLSISRTCP